MKPTHVHTADLFRRLSSEGIHVCVLRNYDTLPDRIERDIDLVVPERDLKAFRRIVQEFARQEGLRLVGCADLHHVLITRFLGIGSDGCARMLCIDEMRGSGWSGAQYLSTDEILAGAIDCGLWVIPRPAHEAATSLLKMLHIGGPVTNKHLAKIPKLIEVDKQAFLRVIERAFGERCARHLLHGAMRADVRKLEQLVSTLRRQHLARTFARSPLATIRWVLSEIGAQAVIKMHRRGIAVQVSGTAMEISQACAHLAGWLSLAFKGTPWLVGREFAGCTIPDYKIFTEHSLLRVAEGIIRERLVIAGPSVHLSRLPRGLYWTRLRNNCSREEETERLIQLLAARPEADPKRYSGAE